MNHRDWPEIPKDPEARTFDGRVIRTKETPMTIEVANWVEDEHGCLNLRHGEVHAFIQKRPVYCDRGHYSFNVDGIPYVDGADSFPRYYMGIENALREATAWLNWRLYKIPFNKDEALITVRRVNGSVVDIP